MFDPGFMKDKSIALLIWNTEKKMMLMYILEKSTSAITAFFLSMKKRDGINWKDE